MSRDQRRTRLSLRREDYDPLLRISRPFGVPISTADESNKINISVRRAARGSEGHRPCERKHDDRMDDGNMYSAETKVSQGKSPAMLTRRSLSRVLYSSCKK